MSRRSQAFAEGVQKFSWQLSTFRDQEGRERHKATCLNHPDIVGIGQSEQEALIKGREQIDLASRKAELNTDPKVP